MNKILALLAVITLSACAAQKTPMINTTDISQVDFSNIDDYKVGTDCAHYALAIFGPFGSAEVVEAIKSAEISKVKVVDYSSTNTILYRRSCVKVYGE